MWPLFVVHSHAKILPMPRPHVGSQLTVSSGTYVYLQLSLYTQTHFKSKPVAIYYNEPYLQTAAILVHILATFNKERERKRARSDNADDIASLVSSSIRGNEAQHVLLGVSFWMDGGNCTMHLVIYTRTLYW